MKKFLEKLIKKFAPKVKEEIQEFAAEAIEKLKIKLENYDYSEKLETAVNLVMTKIKLPLWLKPFKWVIRKVIKETAEGLIEELKEKIENTEVGA
jgi:hypothetical protein